eukprot:CAMPEP_0204038412 /NCGR_PEP_ID=MMETSP0360-20130528/87260_1 /ASSEMBLY_ACC=CAM_ASM_000342 /TAXON_ID=268821 /ORGANISM="Scrippsiella Hangoei, Strain SHTV-5" /LENGTH=189 /DNA_ID=CAMNT_0050984089 /DNA_START=24 /DNA_END=595 /DNA_ORIENTATION=-
MGIPTSFFWHRMPPGLCGRDHGTPMDHGPMKTPFLHKRLSNIEPSNLMGRARRLPDGWWLPMSGGTAKAKAFGCKLTTRMRDAASTLHHLEYPWQPLQAVLLVGADASNDWDSTPSSQLPRACLGKQRLELRPWPSFAKVLKPSGNDATQGPTGAPPTTSPREKKQQLELRPQQAAPKGFNKGCHIEWG